MAQPLPRGTRLVTRVLALDRSDMALDDLARTLRLSGVFREAYGDLEGSMNDVEQAAELYARAGNLAEVAFSSAR